LCCPLIGTGFFSILGGFTEPRIFSGCRSPPPPDVDELGFKPGVPAASRRPSAGGGGEISPITSQRPIKRFIRVPPGNASGRWILTPVFFDPKTTRCCANGAAGSFFSGRNAVANTQRQNGSNRAVSRFRQHTKRGYVPPADTNSFRERQVQPRI